MSELLRLQEAIELAQAGVRDRARELLRDVVTTRPDLEAAWLWLASVAENQTERIEALTSVLALNPANEQARVALEKMGYELPTEPESAETPSNRLRIWEIAGVFVFILVALAIMAQVLPEIRERLTPTATPTPTATATPTTTPTASNTPLPTDTPGPSPTPFEVVTLAPTWTTAPSVTPPPTRTSAPSSTPFPTRTVPPTLTPSNTPPPPTETPEPSATRTPRPSRTPS